MDVASQKSVGDKLKMHKEVPWLLLLVNKIQEEKAKSGLDLNEICTNYSKRSEFLRNLCKDSSLSLIPSMSRNIRRVSRQVKARTT